MPTFDREARDGSEVRGGHHHSHSFSESGRQSVPMWDSSDPDRAPPPLPVPPGSPSLQTRSSASANIQAAAQKLSERATSAYTTNPMPPTSPDKSLIKGAQHRRMQSLQQSSVKDLRSYIDSKRTGSPERPTSRAALSPSISPEREIDYFPSPERGSTTPTPIIRDTPALRPSTATSYRGIFDQNTPPSATVFALKTMPTRDMDNPLSDITNSPHRAGSPPADVVANYATILSLVSAQRQDMKEVKEYMSQLNRRSRDNGTDLTRLKDDADKRDADTRKMLNDLKATIHSDSVSTIGRSSGYGLGVFDTKSFTSPTSASKPFGMPRSNSHNSLFEPGSPNPFSVEGAASVAMLEKIIREMSTKDGQERLVTTLGDMLDKHSKDKVASIETARRVEELADFIKQKPDSQALIRTSPSHDNNENDKRTQALESMSADIIRLLHQVKESASKSGGLSAEIKSRLQDLRGEVLGMGRDIGKQIEETSQVTAVDRSADIAAQTSADVERIVNQGMGQLKDHIASVIRESSQQLITQEPRSEQTSEDMFAAVKQALVEHSSAIVPASQQDGLDRESILEAVKEAYEEFKPEIELQQFGLERDEILQVLKEGLLDYQQTRELLPTPGASMEEVMNAIQQALQDFNPPRPADEMAILRQELIVSIGNMLEGFRPAEPIGMDSEATYAAVMQAVKEGLSEHGPSAPREIEISREDLFDAVKASLDGTTIPFGGLGDQVLKQLHDLLDDMKVEFRQYSAANGRDTEQVLDAMKDGLETLRVEVEQYVDRAQDVTGKDEIVDVVREGLERLRMDVQGYVAEGPSNGRNEMIDYIKTEFEHLHSAIDGQSRGNDGDDNRPSSTSEILAALESGFKGLEGHVGSRGLLDESNEEVMEAMKAEFDALRDAVIAGSVNHKDEVIQKIQESLGSVKGRVEGSDEMPGSSEDVMLTIKDEFNHLREILSPLLLRQGGATDKDEIIDSINQAVDGLRDQIATSEDMESAQALVAIREQIEQLRESLGGGLVRAGGGEGSKGPLVDIKARLDEIAAAGTGSGISGDLLEAMQGEFEQLRQSVSQTMVQGGSRADTEEVLETVRLGLDDLRSHLDKKLDNPEHHMDLNNQLLDALNEGLEVMKADVNKAMDKPADATVNYEILETLKSGLAELKVDMAKLVPSSRPTTSRGGAELVLAEDFDGNEPAEPTLTRELPTEAPSSTASHLKDRMEVLFAQLHIKVEGMAASLGDMPTPEAAAAPEGITLKEDLTGLEDMLRDIQATINEVASRERTEVENAVTKDDTDAIETLIRNTKAQIEELPLPDPATFVTKEHLDAVEAVVRTAHEAIEGLSTNIDENAASKADLAVVEVLVKDLKEAFDGLREDMPKATEADAEDEDNRKLTKVDLDVLGILCTEIKDKIAGLTLPDVDTLPTRSDIEQLTGLIHGFRESHDKVKESYEADISVTAKAFDDRRKESKELAEQLAVVKGYLEEAKDEILAKVTDGETNITTIGETIKTLEENVSGDTGVSSNVKELLETVKNEFERAHGSLEGIKLDHEHNGAILLEKHGEHKDAIVAAIIQKVDTCYDGMMSKYDDAQTAAEDKVKMMEEKALEQQEILASTKEMSDELRLSIDTLGTSLTTFIPTFIEANGKMSEDHKTLFEKVDGAVFAFAESQELQKADQQATRDEVSKTFEGLTGLQADFSEYHPRFSMELKEILATVSQNLQHSKSISENAEQHANSLKEQLAASSEDHKSHVNTPFEDIKSRLEDLHRQNEVLKDGLTEHISGLPALVPTPVEPVEKYDDSGVHEKLDTLVNLAGEAGAAKIQMARLDEIQEQVKATAAEVSAFVALQNKQITEGNESKEREAEEVALLLERRLAQKSSVESEIASLDEEKESLAAVVAALRAEKDALASQKARLGADVSSMNMAMQIRKEELHDMDAKASALEKRILDGLIDHSRAMLLTKKTPRSSPKKQAGRDLRIPTDTSMAKRADSPVASPNKNHAMLMKTRPIMKRNSAAPNSGERRIMSLSQISKNVPTGSAVYSTPTPSLVSAAGQLSRSHSVKTHKMRKSSWGHIKSSLGMGGDKENENEDRFSEEGSELGDGASSHYSSRPGSRDRPMSRDSVTSSVTSGTETGRRSVSYVAGSEYTYGTGSYIDGLTPTDDGRRTSYGTYDTGSYMTGTDLDDDNRRTSYGSTVNGIVGAQTIDEDDEEDEEDAGNVGDFESEIQRLAEQAHREHLAEQEAHQNTVGNDGKEVVPWAPPSDSGLGTDLPTAQPTSSESSYFHGPDGAKK